MFVEICESTLQAMGDKKAAAAAATATAAAAAPEPSALSLQQLHGRRRGVHLPHLSEAMSNRQTRSQQCYAAY